MSSNKAAKKHMVEPKLEPPPTGAEPAEPQAEKQPNGHAATQADTPCCGNCIFFNSDDGVNGLCRGGPPQIVVMGWFEDASTGKRTPQLNAYWPPVNRTVYCGAWLKHPNR